MTPLSLEEIARRQEARRERMGTFGHKGTPECLESEADLAALLEMVREVVRELESFEEWQGDVLPSINREVFLAEHVRAVAANILYLLARTPVDDALTPREEGE